MSDDKKCGWFQGHSWVSVKDSRYGRNACGSTFYYTKRCTDCGKTVSWAEFVEDMR